MTLSVRLPDRVEEELAEYCVKHRVSKSEAVKRALMRLFEQPDGKVSAYDLAKRFMGSDKRPGDVARHSKRLLRELSANSSPDVARHSKRLLRELRDKSPRG